MSDASVLRAKAKSKFPPRRFVLSEGIRYDGQTTYFDPTCRAVNGRATIEYISLEEHEYEVARLQFVIEKIVGNWGNIIMTDVLRKVAKMKIVYVKKDNV